MPLYEYECRICRKRTERIEKISGPHLKICPHCKGPLDRLLSAPAVQFKGSGWYVTDYAKPPAAVPAGEAAKSEGAPAATAETAAARADGKAKPKPAAAVKSKK